MPGGAIGPNVHMMVKAGILDRYSEVLEEFPVVVEAGGAWTSVTPGSQQYWLQAFNNVLHGRWKKIDPGFGKSVLGYFGRTPLPPDPEVMRAASEQLELPVFEGDPLEAAPKNIGAAQDALRERGLEVSDKNTFLVLAAMVPGKKMELNEGIRLLTGKPKIDIPFKKKEAEAPATPPPAPAAPRPALSEPVTTVCTVSEDNVTRTFTITVAPVGTPEEAPPDSGPSPSPAAAQGTPVHSSFAGSVDVSDVKVKVGDAVSQGQVVATVEAMKAQHDILAPVSGSVAAVHVAIGDEIDSTQPILTLA
jgi:pyruvate carboxylase subunit B